MRSIAFFLIVFCTLLVVLKLVVDNDPPEAPRATEFADEAAFQGDPAGNFFELPFFDAEKERLLYRLSGYLEDDAKIPNLKEVDHFVLYRGELEIPIYDYDDFPVGGASAPASPGSPAPVERRERVNRFFFEFERAEYREVQDERADRRGVITLTGPGRGRAEDGTQIDFQNLVINIEKEFDPVETPLLSPPTSPEGAPSPTAAVDEVGADPAGRSPGAPDRPRSRNVYRISTDRPVSITHRLLTVESPSGLEARMMKKDKLRHIKFKPPVWTYLDTQAAGVLGFEPAGRSEGRSGGGTARAGDGSARSAEGLVAITSEGPLVFDRTSAPKQIKFSDDVFIYPVAARTPGESPPRGDSWFHCQLLRLVLQDSGVDPETGGTASKSERAPGVSQAQALWEGGRVQGAYRGFRFDGKSLVWRNLDPSGARDMRLSEATLDGRPRFEGERLEFTSERAILKLAERRIILEEQVAGSFRLPESAAQARADSEGDGGDGGDEARKPEGADATDGDKKPGLPEKWDFEGDRAEIVFRTGDEPRAAESGGAASQLRRIEAFQASSERDDGLVLSSAADERFVLRGRLLTYSSDEAQVVLEGGSELRPQFADRRNSGTAERLVLLLNENVLRFDNRVFLDLDLDGLLEEDDEDGSPPDEAGAADADVARTPNAADGARETLQIVSEQLDVLFRDVDGKPHVDSAIARTKGRSPVTLTPISPQGVELYRIEGPFLHWDDEKQLATMEAVDAGSDSWNRINAPRLEFDDGFLTARKLEFDRARWTVRLDGGVEIRGVVGEKRVATVGGQPREKRQVGPDAPLYDHAMVVRCDRAEVGFFENLEPVVASGDDLPELDRVRSIHAWGAPKGWIEISRPDFSARAREATWDGEKQRLELFGEGSQEFRRQGGDLLKAKRIAYRRADGILELRQEVEGQIKLRNEGQSPVVWTFETPVLDAEFGETPAGSLDLVRFVAREKVFLECASKGIQLHGDDLEYDHAEGEIRVFSRHERFQHLLHTFETQQGDTGKVVRRTNKIDSREIRVWHREETPVLGHRGPKRDAVVIKFYRDVMAAFHAPDTSSAIVPAAVGKTAGLWKLRADHLLLRVLLDEGKGRVPYAYAEGSVDFTSEQKRAMAREAIYHDDGGRLILKGDAAHPVRLYYEGETIEGSNMELQHRGGRFHLKSRRRS